MPASGYRDSHAAGRRSTTRPDREFLKKLEDDSLWDSNGPTRPVRTRPPRREKRSRLVALVALVATALVIVIAGFAFGVGDSGSQGRGQSAPFELLPLQNPVETSTLMPAGGAAGNRANSGLGILVSTGREVAI